MIIDIDCLQNLTLTSQRTNATDQASDGFMRMEQEIQLAHEDMLVCALFNSLVTKINQNTNCEILWKNWQK